MNSEARKTILPKGVTRLLWSFLTIGAITFLSGVLLAPQRIWPDSLLVSYFLVELSLAAVVFLAAHAVSGAGWYVAFRRVPEAMASVLPAGAIALAIVLLAHPQLYPWVTAPSADAQAFEGFKRAWLSRPFFLVRSAIYLALWIAFASAIIRNSRRQDKDGDPRWTLRSVHLSAGFLVVLSITLILASFDWIMSLQPRWYSTIFGFYDFSSMFLGGLAAITLLMVWVRHLAPTKLIITDAHLHDMGKLLFAFSIFWAYIWFCQYMLIWYGNIPDETSYFVNRVQGLWGPLFVLNLLLNWAVPFLALLSRKAKKTQKVLITVAALVLLGRWLDLYLMILPPFAGTKPVFGVWEIGLTLGAIGFFCLVFFRALLKASMVPLHDRYLMQSLHGS